MDRNNFLQVVPTLSDLELAVLLCLIAKEHCLIRADGNVIGDVAAELALIVSQVFRLSHVVLSREDIRNIDKFGEAILDNYSDPEDDSHEVSEDDFDNPFSTQSRLARVGVRLGSQHPLDRSNLDVRKVVNVVIAPDFNLAPKSVQIRALELVRRGKIYSRTTLHYVPKKFIFIPLINTSRVHIRLTDHLNDKIFISHTHEYEDGLPNLEDIDTWDKSDDRRSSYSRSRSSNSRQLSSKSGSVRIGQNIIEQLRTMGQSTTMTPEIRRYLQDIVVFLRLARGVDGGVSSHATNQFVELVKYLAPLHGIKFVTPSLVALAAKKIYVHRIAMSSPERERSTQYGTDLETAKKILEEVTPEAVIESVINTVPCPL